MPLLRSFKVFFCKATAPPEQLKDEVVVLVRRAIGVIVGQQADLVRRPPLFRTLKFFESCPMMLFVLQSGGSAAVF